MCRVIQEDYTIESHALPPSQPQPPAHGRRTELNGPNAASHNHLTSQQAALANQKSAVRSQM